MTNRYLFGYLMTSQHQLKLEFIEDSYCSLSHSQY